MEAELSLIEIRCSIVGELSAGLVLLSGTTTFENREASIQDEFTQIEKRLKIKNGFRQKADDILEQQTLTSSPQIRTNMPRIWVNPALWFLLALSEKHCEQTKF